MSQETITNRERWLGQLKDTFAGDFRRLDFPLPERIRLTCGFPSHNGLGRKRRVVGQCWSPVCSTTGHVEIFVPPTIDDSADVAAVLVHELVHAAVGVEAGHGGTFRKVAIAIGLEGPMRSTIAGAALRERLNALSEKLGPYPHSSLCPDAQLRSHAPPKQSTRMLKLACPVCSYTVRTTRKWISFGLPVCPCGRAFEFIQ